jgi:AcrR family transcriptional regulator
MAERVHSPRERMVYATAQLVRSQGVTGTGLREVVARAEAPRGSLQHYFPGGKEQLVGEALAWSAAFAADRVEQYAAQLPEPTPGALFAAMVQQWVRELPAQDFACGCPLVAAAADTAADSEVLRGMVRDGFALWLAPVASTLRGMGVSRARSRSLATLMISALEGAVVLARAQRDVAPLRTVVRELRPMLDAAAPAGQGR